MPLTKSLSHLLLVPVFLSLSSMWWHRLLLLLEARVWTAVCLRQAITGRLRLCVCLCSTLSGDRVEQRHGNSLSGLLESCYQVLDSPEISFLHTRSGLKHKKEKKKAEENSASPSQHQTPRGENEEDGTGPA